MSDDRRGKVYSYPGDRRDVGVCTGREILWLAGTDSIPGPHPDQMPNEGEPLSEHEGVLFDCGMTLCERRVAALEARVR